MIDYALVLEVINTSKDPVEAFKAFVAQENEAAAYAATAKAREAWVQKEREKSQRTGYPWD